MSADRALLSGGSFLKGTTNYGDSVENEWLIVYLLRELSLLYPALWIRMTDTDGEFLLIEAANALPRWLNPEIAEYRVWLNAGRLTIIPRQEPSAISMKTNYPTKLLTLDKALEYIGNHRIKLLYDPSIESEAFYRLQKYPKHILDSLHSSVITIPRKLAYILQKHSAYISPAIEAFYLRDPIGLRSLKAEDTSRLYLPPNDLVDVSVRFTKVGYAQLKSQQFEAPGAWAKIQSSRMTTALKSRLGIGVRVTCGFELLLADPQYQDRKTVRELKLLLNDIDGGEDPLPSDETIATWKLVNDDESWLDINFEDFENELGGKSVRKAPRKDGGFADVNTQNDLRKMVARFEDFLDDDKAGANGAEGLDDMDYDDEEEDGDSEGTDSDGSEDSNVGFDDAEFISMMREMMGAPAAKTALNIRKVPAAGEKRNLNDFKDDYISNELEEEDEGAVQELTRQMEAELRQAGALRLDPIPDVDTETKQISRGRRKRHQEDATNKADLASEDEGEIDVDLNLAKNLLESFKSQGGNPGPGGNLLGLMGMRLPRDEDGGNNI